MNDHNSCKHVLEGEPSCVDLGVCIPTAPHSLCVNCCNEIGRKALMGLLEALDNGSVKPVDTSPEDLDSFLRPYRRERDGYE